MDLPQVLAYRAEDVPQIGGARFAVALEFGPATRSGLMIDLLDQPDFARLMIVHIDQDEFR